MEKIVMIGGMSIYCIYCFIKIKFNNHNNTYVNVTNDLAKIDKFKKNIRDGIIK